MKVSCFIKTSPKFHEIRCESTKTTKKQFLLANSKAISTSLGALGLDLTPVAPSLFISSEHSPRLGHTRSHLGGHGPGMPPRGAGSALMGTRSWCQRSGSSSFEFLSAERDSVEKSGYNVLQSTFCFQLSTVFQFH